MTSEQPRWVPKASVAFDDSILKVFNRPELADFINYLKDEGVVPKSLSLGRFLETMLEDSPLTKLSLKREGRSTGGLIRYVWGDQSAYAIATSIKAQTYLSHASAMFLHSLTDQLPKTLYVNREQSPKPPPPGISRQASINLAFRRAPRKSQMVYIGPTARYVMLSGKSSSRLGVIEMKTPYGDMVETTDLERTLVDIVVRPIYAGGILEVAKAYRAALGRVDPEKLAKTLAALDLTYPYHQSIGFLLEHAGFTEEALGPFESQGIEWEFFLDYQMKSPSFDDRWKIFFPEVLESSQLL